VSKRKKFRLDFGNDETSFDDDFKIGISIRHYKKTQQSELKLYESFYKSDIIVASPLAMRLVTGQENDITVSKDKKLDFDFLSSLEVLVFD
jgi:U3 small nucleolar RNA-associated protein 25